MDNEFSQVKKDVQNAEKYFQKPLKYAVESLYDEMETYRRWVAGRFTKKDIGITFTNHLPVNEFWVNKSVVLPTLYFKRPELAVNPANERYETEYLDPQTNQPTKKEQDPAETSKLVEGVLNYYSSPKALDDEKMFSKIIDDAYVCGFGVHFSGWAYERGETDMSIQWEKAVPFDQKANQLATERVLALKQANGEAIPGEQLQSKDTTKVDALISQYVSPFNFGVDPECTDPTLKDARFVYINYRLPTEYVNRIFGTSFNGANLPLGYSKVDQDPNNQDLSFKRNDIKAVWNRNLGKVFWVADEKSDGPIKVVNWPWAMEGFPTTILMFNQQNDTFQPIPDFRQIKHLVLEKMRCHSKLAELLQRMSSVYLCDQAIEKLLGDILTGGEARVIPVDRKNNTLNLSEVIKQVVDFTVSADILNYIYLLNAAIERTSGIPDYMRGLSMEAKKSATEIVQMGNQQNLRIDEKKTKISNFIIDVNRKRLQLLQENAVQPQIVKITHNNKAIWKTWSRADIQGDFDFDLDVSTMLAKNKEVQRKQAMDKYDKLRNDPMSNPKPLLKDVYDAFGDNNIQERIVDLPPPPPPKPEIKLSVSMKIEPQNLADPQIMALIQQAGINLPQAQPVQTPEAQGQESLGLRPQQPLNIAANEMVAANGI